jgi:tRNA(fMet)-specific endonuclease VapC
VGTLVDTSVLIDVERRPRQSGAAFGPLLVTTLQAVVSVDEEIAISAVTASDLLHGIHRATSPHRSRREAFVEAILEALPTIPFDLRAARAHARIWADLAATGSDIGAHDRLIAATALSLGWTVTTSNARHFAAITGLRIVTITRDS